MSAQRLTPYLRLLTYPSQIPFPHIFQQQYSQGGGDSRCRRAASNHGRPGTAALRQALVFCACRSVMGCHGTPSALRRSVAGARRRDGFLVRKPTQRIDARSLSTQHVAVTQLWSVAGSLRCTRYTAAETRAGKRHEDPVRRLSAAWAPSDSFRPEARGARREAQGARRGSAFSAGPGVACPSACCQHAHTRNRMQLRLRPS